MENFYLCNTAIFELSKSAAKVYSFLCMSKNSTTNSSFYKKRNIAQFCKVSESTVTRAIRELCDKGLLEVKKRFKSNGRQTSNTYILLDNQQHRMWPVSPSSEKNDEITELPSNKPKVAKRASQDKLRIFKCNPAAFHSNLSPNELKVYTYLAFRSGKDNQCFPSKKEIASDCRISVSTVSRAVKNLRSCGLISISSQTRAKVGGNNGTSVNLYGLIKRFFHNGTPTKISGNPIRRRSKQGLCFISFLARLTPSLVSPVTPQRTISRTKVTLKQRKEQVSTKLTKSIFLSNSKRSKYSSTEDTDGG